jgi:hypothetical protein
MDNDEFLKAFPRSEILRSDSSEKIFANGTFQPACVPRSFGYSDEDAEIIFPFTRFEKCEKVRNQKKQIIWIDPVSNTLYMTCNGIYFLGEKRDQEKIGFDIYNGTGQRYTQPVKLSDEIEWAFGTCTENTKNVEGATYINFKNHNLYLEVQKRMQEVQDEINETYKTEKNTTPLTVLFLSIDSLSRKLFYRRLPKTRKYLESLSPRDYRIFDFKISNIIGDNSIPNVYSLLTGYTLGSTPKSTKETNSRSEQDLIYYSSIWTYMKEKGWVTMFATEFCDNYFSNQLGRKPSVDHLSCKFWCAAEKLSQFKDTGQTQRCIGNKNSHFYILNYTLQYIENYQGVNKWAHIMTLPAHEDSGTVISSLDDDLVDFLKKLFNTKDKILLFLLADHGPRYGNWKKSLDGAQEHKLPALFLVGSTSFLKKIPKSFAFLSHNTRRLVVKTDLFMTLQHISLLPYYQKFKTGSPQDVTWRTGRYQMYGLMMEKIPAQRTCQDSGIEKLLCSCNNYHVIDLETIEEEHLAFLMVMAKAAVYEINQESQTNFFYEGRKICEKVSLKKIEKVEVFKYSRCRHAYRFFIRVQEFPSALVEAEVFALCNRKMRKPARFFYDFQYIYWNGKIIIKVEYIKRIDENPCKAVPLRYGISPHVCFCKRDSSFSINN